MINGADGENYEWETIIDKYLFGWSMAQIATHYHSLGKKNKLQNWIREPNGISNICVKHSVVSNGLQSTIKFQFDRH